MAQASGRQKADAKRKVVWSFRWKLLLFLLCFSLLPVIALRTFGIHSVQHMSGRLLERIDLFSRDIPRTRVQSLLDSYAILFSRAREQVEMGLLLQAHEARRLLQLPAAAAAPAGRDHCLLSLKDQHVSFSNRLGGMRDAYRTIHDHIGSFALHHFTTLNTGEADCFPCRNGGVAGELLSRFYHQTRQETFSMWGYPVAANGVTTIPVIHPLYKSDEEETLEGATGVLVSIDSLLAQARLIPDLPQETRIMIATIEKGPEGLGLQIRRPVFDQLRPAAKETFLSPDGFGRPGLLTDILNRITRLQPAVHLIEEKGVPAYWGVYPLPNQSSALILAVAEKQLMTPASNMARAIRQQASRVERYTAVFLVGICILAAAAALVFSRAITRPLNIIAQTARRIAKGEFRTRCDVSAQDEFGQLAEVMNTVGPQLEKGLRLRSSIALASEIQHHFLPDRSPDIPGLDMFGLTLFCEAAGGDYFDYLCEEKGEGRVCICIGDVSGHDIPAALLMAGVRSAFRVLSRAIGRLGEVIVRVNEAFAEDVEESGHFMTLLLARIDRFNRTVTWVRAGHDPAILYDPESDRFDELDGSGVPLGIDAETAYSEMTRPLTPKTVLFFGTDGIWEATDAGGRQFGKERLRSLIRRHAGKPAKTIALSILDAVEEFRSREEPEDDLTCVVVKITER
jgi:sigma-B regulation protein RsbU (phosphoserine phosphatase)